MARQSRHRQTRRRQTARMSGAKTGSSGNADKGLSGWSAAAVVLGLILVCFAFFMVEMTGRTLLFWLSRADYVRTELEVTELSGGIGDEEAMVFGIVAATGEEIHSSRIPTELFEFDSPSDATGTLMNRGAAIGKRIPIWFAENHKSFFSSARIQYVSEFDTLPSGTLVLGMAAVNLSILAFSVSLFVFGVRRRMRTSLTKYG